MYTNLIVGVDGEQGGRDAAALAAQLASADASITLVHVSTVTARTNEGLGLDPSLAVASDLPLLLERELGLCGNGNVCLVPADSVGAGLEDTAGRRGADVIVLGCSTRRGLARIVPSDDVRLVAHQAPIAVAVAPRGYATRPGIVKRVGVACDGSPESEVAVAHGALLASDRNRELVLRHVVEPHYYPAGWGMVAAAVDDRSSEIAEARGQLAEVEGMEVEHVYGSVRSELVEFSETVDLLVCGSRHNGFLRRVAQGSTSDYLTRHVDIPLVITPAIDSACVQRWQMQRQAAV